MGKEVRKIVKNGETTGNKIQTNNGSGNDKSRNNTSNKSKVEECNESCKQSNFVNSMNNYYNPKKSDSTDYLNKGVPDYGLSFEDSGLGPILAGTGIILGKSGFPLAGLVLTMPQTGLDISKGVKEIKNGNVERGVEYISSGVALGLGGYLIYQDSKTTVNQTTNKGVTPEKYYELKNKVGMTPEVAEVVNKNYGTNYIPAVTQLNSSQNRRDEFLSQVENKKLKNLIEQDYRENGSVNDGGVASVIGMDVGGSDHIEKSRNLYDAYRKILNQSNDAKRNIEGAAKAGKDISGKYVNKDIILNEREEKVIKELIENLKNGRSNFFNNK